VLLSPIYSHAQPSDRLTLSPLAQTRLTNLAANISNQQDALYRRLVNVTDRLHSRLEKSRNEGNNVDAAADKIIEAKTALIAAESKLRTIDADVSRFVGSTNPREEWRNLKTTYRSIHTDLGAAHKSAVEALLLLKTASPSSTGESASTTSPIVE
jgi:hypothetical protein